jgi:hypothetical protein
MGDAGNSFPATSIIQMEHSVDNSLVHELVNFLVLDLIEM